MLNQIFEAFDSKSVPVLSIGPLMVFKYLYFVINQNIYFKHAFMKTLIMAILLKPPNYVPAF
jgi:hypothetical protein